MIQNFDYFGQPEYPYIVLTNPDKTELFSLGLAYETNIKKKFNALSEFSFKFPQSIDGGITNIEAYDYLNNKRLVKVEGFGYFLITDCQEDSEGAVPIKKVVCDSLESELIQKRVTAYGGTRPLWNILSPEDSILYDMTQLAPNWSVGSIDTILLTKQRTFNASDTNIYNFLMNDVSKAFECVFIFDTDARTISAKYIPQSTTTSDIFLSFNNVINTASFSEKSDEISTCLAVYGGGSLNIRAVNPLGTDKIYNFSYYKTTEWMSQDLVDAITAWEILVDLIQPGYANHLTIFKGYNSELITLNSELAQLQSDYDVLETEKKVLIQTAQSLTAINAQMLSKKLEMVAKETSIANKQLQVDSTLQELRDANTLVSFDTNFTPAQLLELDNFIYQNTYKNENIIQTDIMTDVEIQDAQQDLYDQALGVLDKVAQPRYEISLDSANYVSQPDFSIFTSQTEVGTTVTCEITEDVFIEAVILEIEMTFDNPENFSILLSNRVRKDGSGFVYSDLMGQVVKTGASVSFDNLKWSNWESTYKDEVSTFITSSLNTATNNLINNNNQEILINQNGLRGRTYNPGTGTYDNTQVWLTSSVLAFSDDGFATSKLALGSVTTSGGTKFGLVAEVIIGNLIAGSNLTITNVRNDGKPSNFLVNDTGVTLTNAVFTVNNTYSRVLINPDDLDGKSFRIQKRNTPTSAWNDKFWINSAGDVFFSGNLSGASGTFTGDITGASGIFSGTIYADKLDPSVKVSYNQLTDIPANKITSGQMSGSRLSGGTWAGTAGLGGGIVTISNSGGALIDSSANGASLLLKGISAVLTIGNNVSTTASFASGSQTVSGSVSASGGFFVGTAEVATQTWVTDQGYGKVSGRSTTYVANEINGDSSWTFTDGLVQTVTYSSRTRGVSTSVNPYNQNTGTWVFTNGRRTT